MIFQTKDNTYVVYEMVAAILHLCNLEFDENCSKNATISNDVLSCESLKFAAEFLHIDTAQLIDAITTRKIKTKFNQISYVIMKFIVQMCLIFTFFIYRTSLNGYEAKRARDSIAKSIYKDLFHLLVHKMNNIESESSNFIGILDIAGFGLFFFKKKINFSFALFFHENCINLNFFRM